MATLFSGQGPSCRGAGRPVERSRLALLWRRPDLQAPRAVRRAGTNAQLPSGGPGCRRTGRNGHPAIHLCDRVLERSKPPSRFRRTRRLPSRPRGAGSSARARRGGVRLGSAGSSSELCQGDLRSGWPVSPRCARVTTRALRIRPPAGRAGREVQAPSAFQNLPEFSRGDDSGCRTPRAIVPGERKTKVASLERRRPCCA
jgi:hypothetical protein